MSSGTIVFQPPGNFPLAIPTFEGAPIEWPAEEVAKLAALPAEEFQRHVLALLRWYVKEDDVQLGLSGNEYWEAGFHQAGALLAAQELREPSQVSGSSSD